jgi:hypothetical protein
LSASTSSSFERFPENEGPHKQPPKILFVVGLLSVLLGTFLGVYGVISRTSLSTPQQFGLGAAGYFLTAVCPIVLLLLIDIKDKADLENNEEQAYDFYAGQKLMDRIKKVAGAGLLCASFSIIVFFWPIAQEFAK